jgi:hypothetical protein
MTIETAIGNNAAHVTGSGSAAPGRFAQLRQWLAPVFTAVNSLPSHINSFNSSAKPAP